MKKLLMVALCLLLAGSVFGSGVGDDGIDDGGIGDDGISGDGIIDSGPSGTGVKIDGEYVLIDDKYWVVD